MLDPIHGRPKENVHHWGNLENGTFPDSPTPLGRREGAAKFHFAIFIHPHRWMITGTQNLGDSGGP